jgi:hypothetical protein
MIPNYVYLDPDKSNAVLSLCFPSAQNEQFHSTNLFIHGTCADLSVKKLEATRWWPHFVYRIIAPHSGQSSQLLLTTTTEVLNFFQ